MLLNNVLGLHKQAGGTPVSGRKKAFSNAHCGHCAGVAARSTGRPDAHGSPFSSLLPLQRRADDCLPPVQEC